MVTVGLVRELTAEAARRAALGAGARLVGTFAYRLNRADIERIVHAKGIDRAAAEFDAVLMPTPAAVLEGARLVADGCAGVAGLGPLLVVDPGGATTDVHSIADGTPSDSSVIPQGLPEPRIKRTVEGDLGMRHNAATIVETVIEWLGRDFAARERGLQRADA